MSEFENFLNRRVSAVTDAVFSFIRLRGIGGDEDADTDEMKMQMRSDEVRWDEVEVELGWKLWALESHSVRLT